MDTITTGLDLHQRVALAMEYIRNNPDRARGFRPYFSYQLLDAPVYLQHTFFDVPHVVGRFLDAIYRAERMDVPADGEVHAGLVEQLFGCLGADGFGYADPGRTSPREAIMHDQREVLLGLTGLIAHRRSERALQAAHRLCRAFAAILQPVPDVPGPALRSDGGWADATAWEPFRYPPANGGRMITALAQYFQVSRDAMALDLAQRLVDYNLARCFHADGTLTPWAGFHLHSITGLVESVAEFGLLVNDHAYVRRAKDIYDVGLRPYVSSFGWVKENIANASNDGEANNTGDVLRTALLLGRAGYPAYYEPAERMLRNHLLASQLLDVEWIRTREDAQRPDEHDRSYAHVAERARGGFGFTTPNDWVTDQVHKVKQYPLNADIVQGSVQAIVACWEQAVVCEPIGVKVNLFLTRATREASVISHLPAQGRLEVTLHVDHNLLVRVPSWLKPGDITVRVGGVVRPALATGHYLLIPNLSHGTRLEIDLPLAHRSVQEHVNYKLYQEEWLGDTLVALTPQGPHRSLYSA